MGGETQDSSEIADSVMERDLLCPTAVHSHAHTSTDPITCCEGRGRGNEGRDGGGGGGKHSVDIGLGGKKILFIIKEVDVIHRDSNSLDAARTSLAVTRSPARVSVSAVSSPASSPPRPRASSMMRCRCASSFRMETTPDDAPNTDKMSALPICCWEGKGEGGRGRGNGGGGGRGSEDRSGGDGKGKGKGDDDDDDDDGGGGDDVAVAVAVTGTVGEVCA